MFRGSLPADLKAIIAEAAARWEATDCYVGCSGNFTIERTLHGKFALHGNDVQIYSSVLGAGFADDDPRLAIRDEYGDRFGWLEASLDTPTSKMATILLCSRMLQGVDSDNAHYRRMRDEYERSWAALHAKTVDKVRAAGLHLASFYCGDVATLAQQSPRDQAFICFPPFFAGDYESQFRHLDKVFDWDCPTYDVLDSAGITRLFDHVADHRHWLIGNNVRRADWEHHLLGRVQTQNRGVTIWIYGSGATRRVVTPHQRIASPKVPHLDSTATIGGRMTLAALTGPEFAALRSQYMAKGIRPGEPNLVLAVLVDGVLIGALAYSLGLTFSRHDSRLPGPHAYMLSDFPVDGTAYPKLSKLIVMAGASDEARRLCERSGNRRYRGVTTTAFSARPSSMKYRGPLKLLKRTETKKDGSYEGQGFELMYGAPFGQWTLAEALDTWKAKHGDRR